MPVSEKLLICVACGTQFDNDHSSPLKACKICDDPRQFVPPQGQTWTNLGQMKSKFQNKWKQDGIDGRIWSIWTEPKFGIGQRAFLLQTPAGNILWDLIALLDQSTIDFINSKGGLKAIVISHPHYYTTHIDWSTTFSCPVYVAAEDAEWLSRSPVPDSRRKLINEPTQEILPGVTAVKLGGHFPGSLVLHWERMLFIADTFVTVPSALYHIDRPTGTTSFAFMWSIPNMIPLSPDAIMGMWNALKSYDFESTHGAFVGMDVRDPKIKERVLESMKIQVKAATGSQEGYEKLRM